MGRRSRHFNPANAGCTVALDARFITGLNAGDAVQTWTGRPNTTVNASQATLANRPSYQTNEINGRPALRFDGSNDFMTLNATALFQNVGSGFAVAVCRDTNNTGGDAAHVALGWSNGISTSSVRLAAYTRLTSNIFVAGARRLDADVFASSGSISSNSSANIIGTQARWSSGNFNLCLNGSKSTNGTFSASGNTSNTASLNVFLASPDGAAVRMTGPIAAVVAASPLPSDPICKRIEHHLAFSFNIACA